MVESVGLASSVGDGVESVVDGGVGIGMMWGWLNKKW